MSTRPSVRPHARTGVFRFLPGTLLSVILTGGCSDSGDAPRVPHPITPPASDLVGEVRLVGNLFTKSGQVIKQRIEEDADSLRVYLLALGADTTSTGAATDSAWTEDGAYRFVEPPPGNYRVALRVARSPFLSTRAFAWNGTAAPAPLLTVLPHGPLECVPNPFADDHGVGAQGVLPRAGQIDFEARSLAGTPWFRFEYDAPEGFYHIHCGGDPTAPPIPHGPHWLCAFYEGEQWYNVVWSEEE